MFKENDYLVIIEGEVSKLKNAVTHIEQSKEAASKAVNVAETTNNEFREHLQKVLVAVDSILKPHQELISTTESLTRTISGIDFPARFDKQGKELQFVKIIAIAAVSVSLIGTVLILLHFK